MEIKDNHEEALIAGQAMLDLAAAVSLFLQPCSNLTLRKISAAEDIDESMDQIVQKQLNTHPHPLLHTVAYY